MDTFFFWLFSFTAVSGALGVAFNRNPVRGALWLVECLFSLAILFIMLDAHMMAALEVLVYAGAVMVLFLFVIMLLNLREEELGPRRFTLLKSLGLAGALYVGWLLAVPMWKAGKVAPTAPESYGTVEAIGVALFRDYLLPFELTSVLLLVAVVGAVVLAKRRI
jgi:NADH-quinone oxidoreductase subunit J